MNIWTRLALALAGSLVCCAAAQYAITAAMGETVARQHVVEVFTPLAVMVAVVTAIFGAVALHRASYAGFAALGLLAVMLAVGVPLYVVGVRSVSPGVGGNVFYGVSQVVDFYYLAPCAVAVPIHWLLLRSR
jgi:hypothetical protein